MTSKAEIGGVALSVDEHFVSMSDAGGGYDLIQLSKDRKSLEAMRDYFDALLNERPELTGD